MSNAITRELRSKKRAKGFAARLRRKAKRFGMGRKEVRDFRRHVKADIAEAQACKLQQEAEMLQASLQDDTPSVRGLRVLSPNISAQVESALSVISTRAFVVHMNTHVDDAGTWFERSVVGPNGEIRAFKIYRHSGICTEDAERENVLSGECYDDDGIFFDDSDKIFDVACSGDNGHWVQPAARTTDPDDDLDGWMAEMAVNATPITLHQMGVPPEARKRFKVA